MELTFYKFKGTPNRVDKSNFLDTKGKLSNVKIKGETSLIKPTFILKTADIVFNSNYVYCNVTGRFYYIDNFRAITGNRIEIECTIDVLHTYRQEIYNSKCWVETSGNEPTADSKMLKQPYSFRQDKETLSVKFPNDVFTSSTPNVLLILTP